MKQSTRLEFEQLEERAVPTANIVNCNFDLAGKGLLHVASENQATGAFAGTFKDYSNGVTIAVTGQLTPQNNGWDTMTFQGSRSWSGVGKGFYSETESVAFSGKIVEACFYMEGTLSEAYDYLH